MWFFLNNMNGFASDTKDISSIKNIFSNFNLNDLYTKWSNDIECLIQKAPQRNYGTLLACSFSKEQLQKSAYMAKPCGFQHTGITIDNNITTNLPHILTTLAYSPENIKSDCDYSMEFCAALTGGQHGLLNPWNEGIRITPYTVEDMSAWNKECEELFAKIADDCKNDIELQKIFEKHRKDIIKQKWIDPTQFRSKL